MDLSPTLVKEYDRAVPDATETATFALGCFWGPDAQFGALDGVVRTRVGYAGGTTADPTYHALGDHTEAVQLEYDPDRIAFGELVERVLASHDPHTPTRKTQYQNVLFAADADQRSSIAAVLGEHGLDPDAMATRVEQLNRFYPAEPYHQKHSLRGTPGLVGVFEAVGYDDEALRESPAAATLNGHAGGHEIGGDFRTALDRQAGPR
ncbi:peptide-methionine (S)-S-oxide reductase MsrA [Halorientalis litorea]|jgi:peptide-methionine (S)-S-oxide reductase|uniref:peptide-methionine (S)-S-oxide reductase MsrA n=1 Tax=Halorientalis litorea TaxID=2931977 RepID=UPI001FF2F9D6|nr:peptide-methionine (S)-S-oxide reductase [Halorientalis litorea]